MFKSKLHFAVKKGAEFKKLLFYRRGKKDHKKCKIPPINTKPRLTTIELHACLGTVRRTPE